MSDLVRECFKFWPMSVHFRCIRAVACLCIFRATCLHIQSLQSDSSEVYVTRRYIFHSIFSKISVHISCVPHLSQLPASYIQLLWHYWLTCVNVDVPLCTRFDRLHSYAVTCNITVLLNHRTRFKLLPNNWLNYFCFDIQQFGI